MREVLTENADSGRNEYRDENRVTKTTTSVVDEEQYLKYVNDIKVLNNSQLPNGSSVNTADSIVSDTELPDTGRVQAIYGNAKQDSKRTNKWLRQALSDNMHHESKINSHS